MDFILRRPIGIRLSDISWMGLFGNLPHLWCPMIPVVLATWAFPKLKPYSLGRMQSVIKVNACNESYQFATFPLLQQCSDKAVWLMLICFGVHALLNTNCTTCIPIILWKDPIGHFQCYVCMECM